MSLAHPAWPQKVLPLGLERGKTLFDSGNASLSLEGDITPYGIIY